MAANAVEPHNGVDGQAALESWIEVSQALLDDRPLSDILDVIARVARDLSGNLYAMVALVDPAAERLIVQGSAGLPDEYLSVLNEEHPLVLGSIAGREETPSSQAFRTGEPVMYADPWADDTFAEYRPGGNRQGYRALLSVPLAGAGELGVITVYARNAGEFRQGQIDLLRALAGAAAAAIEMARLRTREAEMMAELTEVDRMHQKLSHVALLDEGLWADPGGSVRPL